MARRERVRNAREANERMAVSRIWASTNQPLHAGILFFKTDISPPFFSLLFSYWYLTTSSKNFRCSRRMSMKYNILFLLALIQVSCLVMGQLIPPGFDSDDTTNAPTNAPAPTDAASSTPAPTSAATETPAPEAATSTAPPPSPTTEAPADAATEDDSTTPPPPSGEGDDSDGNAEADTSCDETDTQNLLQLTSDDTAIACQADASTTILKILTEQQTSTLAEVCSHESCRTLMEKLSSFNLPNCTYQASNEASINPAEVAKVIGPLCLSSAPASGSDPISKPDAGHASQLVPTTLAAVACVLALLRN